MKIVYVLILSAFMPVAICAQIWHDLDEELYDSRVKLVDEFIARFNGSEWTPGVNSEDSTARIRNICSLFDMDKVLSRTEAFRDSIVEFAKVAVDSGSEISYSDSGWFAKAVCTGTYRGKNVKFDLYLKVQPRGENRYKWMIFRADGDIFALNPGNKEKEVMIGPDAHETNFMDLYDVTHSGYDAITRFMRPEFRLDSTSVFCTMVYDNVLKIEGVEDLIFFFTQVTGYTFRVRFFERDETNSGWLIDELIGEVEENKFTN